MRTSLKAILLAGAVAALSGNALASGGGSSGGGGGSPEMPSSGPQYDPAAEYAKAIAALQAKDYKTAARPPITSLSRAEERRWLAHPGRRQGRLLRLEGRAPRL